MPLMPERHPRSAALRNKFNALLWATAEVLATKHPPRVMPRRFDYLTCYRNGNHVANVLVLVRLDHMA